MSEMISLKTLFIVGFNSHILVEGRAVAWLRKRSPCAVVYDVLQMKFEASGRDQGGSSRRVSTQIELDNACCGYQSITQGIRPT